MRGDGAKNYFYRNVICISLVPHTQYSIYCNHCHRRWDNNREISITHSTIYVSVGGGLVSYDSSGGCAATHATGQRRTEHEDREVEEEAVRGYFRIIRLLVYKNDLWWGGDDGGEHNSCCEPITDINDSRVARQFESAGHSI